MAYTPRPWTWQTCPVCQLAFAARHSRRRYCSPSCNVRASYARTGRRGAPASAAPLAVTQGPGLGSGAPPAPVVAPPPLAAPPVPGPPPRPAVSPASARAVQELASCRALWELVCRNQAEQTARRQFLDRILQAYEAPSPPPGA